MEQRVDAIDPWRNSSGLLDDYAALLTLLATDYPAARLDALAGNPADLVRVRRDGRSRGQGPRVAAEAERAEDG